MLLHSFWHGACRLFVPTAAVLLPACDPIHLDRGEREPLSGSSPSTEGIHVTLEPPAEPSAAPKVLRLRITGARRGIDPSRVVLVRGDVSAAQIRQVQRDAISGALAKRLLPLQIWKEDKGAVRGAGEAIEEWVAAPPQALEPGEHYSLVVGEPGFVFDIQIELEDSIPYLERVWPPEGGSASERIGVFCSSKEVPETTLDMQLEPAGIRGRLRPGIANGDHGRSCLYFEATESGEASLPEGMPPPILVAGGLSFRLDPRPFRLDAEARPFSPLACKAPEIPFGPGCAAVADDRAFVRSPDAPALWSILGDGGNRLLVTRPGEPFMILSLPPASLLDWSVTALDNRGQALKSAVTTTTLAPMPHVILNEMLANPLGKEPAQEWVELINDGTVPAELAGYTLTDGGGDTVLPAGLLPPGGFALIVNDSFSSDDARDPEPAEHALLLRVPKLGRDGLSNTGEPLELRDPSGIVVSRLPALSNIKAGRSLARRYPAAPESEKDAFSSAVPTPGGENAL